ncbi:hypothetical protein K7X08_022145 [Anisodus acutangulus]|uniref:Uncharacterized protein n=1 Tax=Anisodus acutangulus TaxID=402998 RepID=A0A9Q1L7R6_9SOLA|nr:hypothetical protein K7X08_022145 [Anisodus acutangulus]
MKYLCVVGFLVLLGIAGLFNSADGAGECGRNSPDMEAMKLIPCAEAASDENASSSGANPEVAITIPKRCNLVNRPVGYKCGPYIMP